jgi:hypothetical protein
MGGKRDQEGPWKGSIADPRPTKVRAAHTRLR